MTSHVRQAFAGVRRALDDLLPVGRTVRRIEPALADMRRAAKAGGLRVSPLAVVEGPVQVGAGVVIEDHAHVVCRSSDGGAPGVLVIGDGVHVGRFASITSADSVLLGARVIVCDHAVVADTWAAPTTGSRRLPPPEGGRVVIGNDVWLGPNTVICPGVTIGDGAVVMPGAVVAGDVAAGGRAEGSPALLEHRRDQDT